MTEPKDTRPYTLRSVVLDDGTETAIPAYSNHDANVGEWPLFTREQVPALLDATIRSHIQMFWVEEIANYAVVTGYENTLPDPFDITPYMDAILKGEEVDEYRGGKGFNIRSAGRHEIVVDGETIVAFDIDHVGYYFMRALEPATAPSR